MTTIVQLPEAEVKVSTTFVYVSGPAVSPAARHTSSKPVANPATTCSRGAHRAARAACVEKIRPTKPSYNANNILFMKTSEVIGLYS